MQTTETKPSKTIDDILINKTIEVKPIIRNNWLGKGHDGEFMFTGTEFSTQLPISRVSGQYIQVLDKDEQRAIEKELNLPEGELTFYGRKSPFWAKHRVTLSREGKKLDLSNIYDFLSWKILKEDRRIAHSWAERYASGEYKFALVDPEEEVQVKSTKADLSLEAYKIFAKISDNTVRMQDLIKIITGKTTKSDKSDFLKGEIEKLIEKDAKGFVDTYNDPQLNMKILVDKALVIGALERTPSKGYKLKGMEDEDMIGESLTETINFLLNKKNSDVYLRIKSQVETANK